MTSPINGLFANRLVHARELALMGAPLLKLARLHWVTLTVYVSEAELGQVALGQSVDVMVYAYSDTLAGTVSRIASEAEFTPTITQTQAERAHQVFAVKITLDNTDLRLKPGMPACTTLQ